MAASHIVQAMAASHIACFFAFLAVAGEAHVAHFQDHSSIEHKPKLSHVAPVKHQVWHIPANVHRADAKPLGTVSKDRAVQTKNADSNLRVEGNDTVVKKLSPLSSLENQFTNKTDALDLLDLIYQGHSMHPFWRVADYTPAVHEAKRRGIADEDVQVILYGEIIPSTFVRMLKHIGAKPGQQFVDLGSGTGKSVFAAWILGLNATGVEIVNPRWKLACEMTNRLHAIGFRKPANGPGVTFVHSNFMETDLSNADIIFINSKMFTKNLIQQLALKKQSGMKLGAKVISIDGLPGDGFEFNEKFIGPTSWSLATTWTVQTVTAQAKTNPSALAPPVEDRASASNPMVGTDGGASNSDSSVLTPPTNVKVLHSNSKAATGGGATNSDSTVVTPPTDVKALDSTSKAGTGGGGSIIRKETPVTGPALVAKPQQNVEILQIDSPDICNMEEGTTSGDAHQLLQKGAFLAEHSNTEP